MTGSLRVNLCQKYKGKGEGETERVGMSSGMEEKQMQGDVNKVGWLLAASLSDLLVLIGRRRATHLTFGVLEKCWISRLLCQQ